jgi:hypothetical protein
MANTVIDPVTGQSLEYHHLSTGPDKDIWVHGFANNLGRLANGIGTRMPTGTKTIEFINFKDVPADKTVTYGRIVRASSDPKKPKLTSSA